MIGISTKMTPILYSIFICKAVQGYCFDMGEFTLCSDVRQNVKGIFFLNFGFYDNRKMYIYVLLCIS